MMMGRKTTKTYKYYQTNCSLMRSHPLMWNRKCTTNRKQPPHRYNNGQRTMDLYPSITTGSKELGQWWLITYCCNEVFFACITITKAQDTLESLTYMQVWHGTTGGQI
jgi:hypothetical protein